MGDIVACIDVVPPLQGEARPPVEANYGLLLPTKDGYAWVCHEAVTTPEGVRAPRYVRNHKGDWLAVLSDVRQGREGATLFHTSNPCRWNHITGIPRDTQIAAAAFDPASDNRAWAVSNTPEGDNAIFRSFDAGATWEVAVPRREDRLFHTVGVAERPWATATNLDGTEAWFWSVDEKGAWHETEVSVPEGTKGARFAVLDTEGSVMWAVVDPLGEDTLLRSENGGASFAVVPIEPSYLQDGAIVGTGIWLVRNFGFDLVAAEPDGTTTALDNGALAAYGLDVTDGQAWLGVLSYSEQALLQGGPTDGELSILAYPDDVTGPLDCPAGSQVAEVCAPLWAQLEPNLRGFDGPITKVETGDTGLIPTDDTVTDGDPSTCGCQSGPRGPGWALAFLILWFRRRER